MTGKLRYAATISESTPSLVAYLSLPPLVLSMWLASRGKVKGAIAALAIALLGTLAYAERTGLLYKIVAVTYVYTWYNGVSAHKLLALAAVFFLLVMAVAFGTGKLGQPGEEFFIFRYLGVGMSSFHVWISGMGQIDCYSPLLGNALGGALDMAVQPKVALWVFL
jgi:hypothetical protein